MADAGPDAIGSVMTHGTKGFVEEPYFRLEPLRDMVAVGWVRPRAVSLWMRSHRPGKLHLHWWPEDEAGQGSETEIHIPEANEQDNTTVVILPDDLAHASALLPVSRYRFRVVHSTDHHLIGEGRFETAPENPEDEPQGFSIALMSCHQPFSVKGVVQVPSVQMLRATRRCLEQHNTKLVLMVGDQMYVDYPDSLSLLNPAFFARVAPPGRKRLQDCTAAEIRSLYHERYRYFWALEDWQAIHANYPCYPIFDDHEIIDNWGSAPVHQTPEWQAVGEGARLAYFDYQGSRVQPRTSQLPAAFHYGIVYGNIGIFVMDLRSNRRAGTNGQLFSPDQEAALRRFLRENESKPVLGLVLSVPAIHLPRYMAQTVARLTPDGEDFSDRWSSGAHIRDRDRLLRLLHDHQRQHPSQRLILLSGDIHTGCVQELAWEGCDLRFYQMVSSGITHISSWLTSLAVNLSIRCNRRVVTRDNRLGAAVKLLKGIGRYNRNPYGRLNLGIIDIETLDVAAQPKVRFLLYGHDGEKPRCVYRSPQL